MDRTQEIKKFLEETQIKGIKNVIFPESFFFLSKYPVNEYGLEDQSEIFKDFHFFAYLIQNIVARGIKVHIQTNSLIKEKLDRVSVIEMMCDMAAICKREMSDSLMFYHDINVSEIATRLVKNTKPSFGIKVVDYGVKAARNLFLKINRQDKSSYNGAKPEELAIVLDSSFSGAKREELFLGNFRVIELTILPLKKRALSRIKVDNVPVVKDVPKSASSVKVPSTKITNNYDILERGYLSAKKIRDQAYQIYSQLRGRSKEFSQSAVELKMKSDRQKEVLKNIDSMIAKNLTGIDVRDLQDAKRQCRREIRIYDQQCKDFFDLYVQINEQAKDAKDDLVKAEKELKKYSS